MRESRKWNARQPAHMRRADVYSLRHWVGAPFKKAQQAYWVNIALYIFLRIILIIKDGTMNMPILRLADPKHRDCYETRFV